MIEDQNQAAKELATKVVNDKTDQSIVITLSGGGAALALNCDAETGVLMYAMLQNALESNFKNKRDFKRLTRYARKLVDKAAEGKL